MPVSPPNTCPRTSECLQALSNVPVRVGERRQALQHMPTHL